MKKMSEDKMADKVKIFENFIDRSIDQIAYSTQPSEETPFFPSHIHIEPTNACNLRCIHCHHHSGSRNSGIFTRKFGVMKMEIYRKVVDEIAPLKCQITLNCQGEPTLHRKLIHMVEYAKNSGLRVSLLTNGTRLNERLSQQLIDSGVDRIVFSFDAVDKNLYEEIRIRGDFDRTLSNILNFIEKNDRCGHPIFICMSIIIQDKTRKHITDYKTFFSNKPIDTIFESELLNLSGGSGVQDDFQLSEKKALQKSNWPICRVPWENLVVNWDGLVTVCPLDFNGLYVAGDAARQTLEQIWNNKSYREFRLGHLQRDYHNIERNGILCSDCSCLWDEEYDFQSYPVFMKKNILRYFNQIFGDEFESQQE
jgi:MoaA/NifB/PqqE/SkfB family radical SAM enzyme